MIRIALPWLVFAYLLVFLAAIFSVWIAYEFVRRIRETRSQRHRLQCVLCGMLFEDRTEVGLPRCPRCGSLNERKPVKIF
jgi:rRNA maturation endonuclease Nob1